MPAKDRKVELIVRSGWRGRSRGFETVIKINGIALVVGRLEGSGLRVRAPFGISGRHDGWDSVGGLEARDIERYTPRDTVTGQLYDRLLILLYGVPSLAAHAYSYSPATKDTTTARATETGRQGGPEPFLVRSAHSPIRIQN